jgi:CxxC-x17-CxxC domain-containing protein
LLNKHHAFCCTRIRSFFVSVNQSVQSPAINSFADLDIRSTIHRALERMNISIPTKIQAATLPILLEGRDVIGQSRTGSGKTIAFGIPAVESVDPAIATVQVLVLTPTRELAVQVGDVLTDLAAGTGIKTVLVYGGRAMGPQKDALRRGAQIVVGTPGRVADLYGQRDLRLNNVRFLVLDEADEMLDRGFAPQVNQILGWTPKERQTALFSATMPDWVNQASRNHLRNPVHVAIAATQSEQTQIDHIAYDVPAGGKLDALRDLLDARGDGQVIVFGRTKHGVKKLAKQLSAIGYPVAALQGNMSQNARDQVMADFRDGKIAILLATNVAARGIDVTAVDHVINYELPESSDLLQHRIGRTGRMGRTGSAITLLGAEDQDKWRQLTRSLNKQIPRTAWTKPRRTDSVPRVVTHAQPAAQPVRERRAENRQAPPTERTPRGNEQRRRRPESTERTQEPRRDRRESRPATPAPAPRRHSSISVVSEMIKQNRGEWQSPVSEPARGSAPANGSTGRPLWGPRHVADLVDQERFPLRDRGNSRHSDRPAQERHAVATASPVRRTDDRSSSTRERRPSNAERPAHSETNGKPEGQHTAICTNCGGTAVLRFAPDLSRPIYCDTCFAERRRR